MFKEWKLILVFLHSCKLVMLVHAILQAIHSFRKQFDAY